MDFKDIFNDKPIIGMIHLSNRDVKQALEEILILEEEGFDGAIIEDYYGTVNDVYHVLKESSKMNLNINLGVNVLKDPYYSFELADEFGASFVQLDSVQTRDLDLELYNGYRLKYPNIVALGGVGFKYVEPSGNPLEVDLNEGKSRCDAIVTTGEGTGIETPIEKLINYKTLLKDFPLIVGAGLNSKNIYEQLKICDGGIIGSSLKVDGQTKNRMDHARIKEIINEVKRLRKSYIN